MFYSRVSFFEIGRYMNKLKVIVGNDHAGVDFKHFVTDILKEFNANFEIENIGVDDKKSVDYPDIAYAVCDKIINHDADFGVLICGTGLGMSMAANRFQEIRAALCHDATMARLAREHNDANILILGARILGQENTKDIIKAFFETKFLEGRHQNRVNKLHQEGILKL